MNFLRIAPGSELKFSAGEVHAKECPHDLSCLGDHVIIYVPLQLRATDSIPARNIYEQLILSLQAAEILHKKNFPYVSIFLPYLPFSRMDRAMHANEAHDLRVFTKLIQTGNFHIVLTLDAHSDVAEALLPNICNISIASLIELVQRKKSDYDIIIGPDQGANKKLKDIVINSKSDYAFAVKNRNTSTGNIEIVALVGADIKDKNCLIVDDICDGGATFVQLAKELYNRGAKSVDLAVTHGIFSKSVEPLLKANINHIYTTNSMGDLFHPDLPFITVFDVKDMVLACVTTGEEETETV